MQLSQINIFDFEANEKTNVKLWKKILLNEDTQLSFLSLLNELCGDFYFRHYLFKSLDVLEILISLLNRNFSTLEIIKPVIGILQKMSLRNEWQEVMISKSILNIILDILNAIDLIKDEYIFEYTVTLALNLSTNSKAKLIIDEDEELKLLNKLIQSSSFNKIEEIFYSWNGIYQIKENVISLLINEQVKTSNEVIEQLNTCKELFIYKLKLNLKDSINKKLQEMIVLSNSSSLKNENVNYIFEILNFIIKVFSKGKRRIFSNFKL